MVSIKKWRRKTINCLRAGAREYDFKRILETMNTPCTILQHSCFDDAHYCTAIKQLPWFTKNVCNNEKSLPRLQYHLLIKACARMGAMQFPLITLYVHCSVFNTNDMSGIAFIDFTWNHIQFTSHFFSQPPSIPLSTCNWLKCTGERTKHFQERFFSPVQSTLACKAMCCID